MKIHALTRGAVAAGIALASLAACGGDDDAASSTDAPVATSGATTPSTAVSPTTSDEPTSSTAPATSEPAPTGSDAAGSSHASSGSPTTTGHAGHAGHGGPIVRVGLVDYAFGGLPTTVAAGTRLEVTNTSAAELHELVAFRLPDSEQRSVDELVTLPMEEIEPLLGAPVMVLIAPPGADGVPVVGDGVLAEPGRYVVICAIPTGADPQEYLDAAATSDGPPQVAGGPPHFTQGMYAELTVEG